MPLRGGLCAPGPGGGAGGPYTKAAGSVCGSDGLRLPPAHDCTPEGCVGRSPGVWSVAFLD